MSGNQSIIQADYEPLTDIAYFCGDCSQGVQQIYNKISDQVERLRGGEWEGEAAQIFYQTMDQDTLPGIERLIGALRQGGDVLDELIRLFQDADAEACECLNIQGEGEGDFIKVAKESPNGKPTSNILYRHVPEFDDGAGGGGGGDDPVYGTGTGTVRDNTNVRSDPSLDNSPQDTLSGDVTIVGQTVYPDENGFIWYQIEYENADGDLVTGWVRDDVINNETIDWRNNDPLQIYDAEGTLLTGETADNYVTAVSAQQEMLEDYGINVQMPSNTGTHPPTYRPITPDDAEVMEQTLNQVIELEGEGGYGVDLKNNTRTVVTEDNPDTPDVNEASSVTYTATWAPDEINSVYEGVTNSANTAYNEALAMGYDVESPQQVFKDVYICGAANCNETYTLQREYGANRNSISGGERGPYAWNYGGNKVGFYDNSFYGSGTLASGSRTFTPTGLVSHELGHDIRGTIDPAYYIESGGSYTHELPIGQTITYTDSTGTVVTTTITSENNTVTLTSNDSGFLFGGRSQVNDNEIETDIVAAYTVDNAYTIGSEYSLNENLAGLVRQEQGQAMMQDMLIYVYGDPPPPPLIPPQPTQGGPY